MMGIVVVTHGRMGHELLKSAESIVGRQEAVCVLGLKRSDGPKAFEKTVQKTLKKLNHAKGVLVLADMMGGTPCNAALRSCRDPRFHYELVTGVNLPMLVSVFSKRDTLSLEQLAQKIVDDAGRMIQRPIPQLNKHFP